jgi:L-arabinose isomerase
LADVIEAPDHVNLLNPHSRIVVKRPVHEFIEAYSNAGGPHHLCVSYGDIREEVKWITELTGINYIGL